MGGDDNVKELPEVLKAIEEIINVRK